MLVQKFHVRPARSSCFDKVAGLIEGHAAMSMEVGDRERGRAVAAGVAVQEYRVPILCEGV